MNDNQFAPGPPASSSRSADFAGIRVLIIPFPALGDLTIYLRLGWLFHRAGGAQVTFCSNVLLPAREYFSWLTVMSDEEADLPVLACEYDLVIACFEKFYRMEAWSTDYDKPRNIAFVTAKKISRDSGLDGREVYIQQRSFGCASRAFCLDSRAGKTMVDWVDSYALDVFGLKMDSANGLLTLPRSQRKGDLVLIFPTTPQVKKNYWLRGFSLLATVLKRRGWRVEFVCMPAEQNSIKALLPSFEVRSFPDIRALIDHVAEAAVVISNDSGGGHLASMLGVATYTITRRREKFVWRPGFGDNNTVLYPWFRFKWLDKKYVWRPFVPIWRIATQMGQRGQL